MLEREEDCRLFLQQLRSTLVTAFLVVKLQLMGNEDDRDSSMESSGESVTAMTEDSEVEADTSSEDECESELAGWPTAVNMAESACEDAARHQRILERLSQLSTIDMLLALKPRSATSTSLTQTLKKLVQQPASEAELFPFAGSSLPQSLQPVVEAVGSSLSCNSTYFPSEEICVSQPFSSSSLGSFAASLGRLQPQKPQGESKCEGRTAGDDASGCLFELATAGWLEHAA